jgi:hypothetical protein
MEAHSNEAKRKWEILETFCFAYICSPPYGMEQDEEYMAHRDFLMKAIGNNVHVTNWKQLFREYSEMRPVTLSIRHAKEFYEAEVQKEETEAYRAIKSYFLKTDRQREIIRKNLGCDISYITLYLKDGEQYRNPTETWTMETKKIKPKAK